MEDFKIKTDKDIPLHYHLMKVMLNKDRTKGTDFLKYAPSDFYDGNMRYLTIGKRISNL